MDAINTPRLIKELKDYVDKPSEYTLGETCKLVNSAITALEILNNHENAKIND